MSSSNEQPNALEGLVHLSSDLLRQELARRQDEEYHKPECGSKVRGEYNMSLHVFALVLILVLSTLACSFPIIVRRFPGLPVPHRFLFLSRHFGTGVLIATAFVHLLPTAFDSLTDPCLPYFWNEGYPAMPGLVAMVSVLVVVGIEMFFATRGAGHSHSADYGPLAAPSANANGHAREVSSEANILARPGIRHFRTGSIGLVDRAQNDLAAKYSEANGHHADLGDNRRRSSDEATDIILDDDPAEPWRQGISPTAEREHLNPFVGEDENEPQSPAVRVEDAEPAHHHHRSSTIDARAEEQRLLLQCLLLEAGILFHSVFIGMALSVATGTPFVVLLIAISFHQTFEGIALGSRIAAITAFGPGSLKPWFMALAYGTTTPIGQAIGLVVHNLYDPASTGGLIMVGIMNAISSGLLLFAGLVELLAEDFLSDKSYETLRGRSRIEACAAVVGGSMLMALVGAWA